MAVVSSLSSDGIKGTCLRALLTEETMDADRFDALTRFLANRPSRRQVLRGLAGGLTAGLLSRQAGAADCKAAGKPCSKGDQCCSGLCAPPPTGQTSVAHSGSVCCDTGQVIDPSGACCIPDPTSATCTGVCGPQTNNCGQSVDCGPCCTPKTCADAPSQCGSLDDGCGDTITCDCDACQTCSSGTCVPVACTALDECHNAGTCDPGTGSCSNPPAPNGTTCSNGQCLDGACVTSCTPDCTGKCGGAADGCGGTCPGGCGSCETCQNGLCVSACPTNGCYVCVNGGCQLTGQCPDGHCCSDILTYPNGAFRECCCTGKWTPPGGEEQCNPCGNGTTPCYCSGGIGGLVCCKSNEHCGCSGGVAGCTPFA